MGLKESGLRGSLRNVSVGIDAIPDSVVSRPEDNDSGTTSDMEGLQLTLKTDYPDIGSIISNNTEGAETAYLYDTDEDGVPNNELATADVSDKNSGDAFGFKNVDLKEGDVVAILLDANGSSWTRGLAFDEADFPYVGEDIDITATIPNINEAREDNFVRVINDIGNPDGFL